jgi:hypothetical protein
MIFFTNCQLWPPGFWFCFFSCRQLPFLFFLRSTPDPSGEYVCDRFFSPRHMGRHTPIFLGSDCLARIYMYVCSRHWHHCRTSASGSLKSEQVFLCMCTQTRPRFILSSERISNGSKVSCSRKQRNGSSSPGAGSNPRPLGWQSARLPLRHHASQAASKCPIFKQK